MLTLIFDRAVLTERLALVLRIIPARRTYSILGSIKLTVLDSESVSIQGTDLGSWAKVVVPCHVEIGEPGSCLLLPAHLFSQTIAAMYGDDVAISLKSSADDEKKPQKLAITDHQTGWGECHLALLDLESSDFPEFPVVDEKPITIHAEVLAEGFLAVSDFASKDETKQILQGIHVKRSNSIMTMVAADGCRSAFWQKAILEDDSDKPLTEKEQEEIEFTIHSKKAIDLERFCRYFSNESNLSFKASDSVILVQTASFELAFRVIDGMFPDVEQIMKDSLSGEITEVVFSKQSLASSLDLVNVYADDRNHVVSLSFDGTISSESDKGTAMTTAIVREPANIPYPPTVVYLNLEYLKRTLKMCETWKVRFKVGSVGFLGIFPENEESTHGAHYLLAPISQPR